jgi:acyl carrier protein
MISSEDPIPSKDAITEWLARWIANGLSVPPGEIETDKSLLNYSLSSVTAMMLVGDLEEWLGLTLPPTLVWDFPSIDAIVDYLVEQKGSAAAGTPGATEAVPAGAHHVGSANHTDPILSLDAMSDHEVTALLNQLIADERAGTPS